MKRVVRRDPGITPEQQASRRQRMQQAAERMRRSTIGLQLADALKHTGEPMSLAEFAAALEDPEPIPE